MFLLCLSVHRGDTCSSKFCHQMSYCRLGEYLPVTNPVSVLVPLPVGRGTFQFQSSVSSGATSGGGRGSWKYFFSIIFPEYFPKKFRGGGGCPETKNFKILLWPKMLFVWGGAKKKLFFPQKKIFHKKKCFCHKTFFLQFLGPKKIGEKKFRVNFFGFFFLGHRKSSQK